MRYQSSLDAGAKRARRGHRTLTAGVSSNVSSLRYPAFENRKPGKQNGRRHRGGGMGLQQAGKNVRAEPFTVWLGKPTRYLNDKVGSFSRGRTR